MKISGLLKFFMVSSRVNHVYKKEQIVLQLSHILLSQSNFLCYVAFGSLYTEVQETSTFLSNCPKRYSFY